MQRQETVEEIARSWRLRVDIDFCDKCGKGPVVCVELPYSDPEVGIMHSYRCFQCAKAELEDD